MTDVDLDILKAAKDTELVFKNRMEVVRFLNRLGYKIKKSKVYSDVEKGLLFIEDDGTIKESSVMLYIRKASLKSFSDKATSGHGSTLMERKAEKDIDKIQAQIDRIMIQIEESKLKLATTQGEFLPRTDFERELATRAAVLDMGLRHMVYSEIGDWVELVEGNPKKIQALLERINDNFDEKFNEFASTKTFHVIFVE